jgi:hypothetical protein
MNNLYSIESLEKKLDQRFFSILSLQTICNKVKGSGASIEDSTANCPAHNDKLRSLVVFYNNYGIIFMRCAAGCQLLDICNALGIEPNELFVSSFWEQRTLSKNNPKRQHIDVPNSRMKTRGSSNK